MLGTFSRLQAHRASASVFHLGALVGKSQCTEAVIGTRWQHVSVLKELNKIHGPVPFIPSLWSQLLPQGAGSGDGRPLCPLQSEVVLSPLSKMVMESHICCWVELWRPPGNGSQPLVQDGNGVSSLLLGGALEDSSCSLIGCKKRIRKRVWWCERIWLFHMISVWSGSLPSFENP